MIFGSFKEMLLLDQGYDRRVTDKASFLSGVGSLARASVLTPEFSIRGADCCTIYVAMFQERVGEKTGLRNCALHTV